MLKSKERSTADIRSELLASIAVARDRKESGRANAIKGDKLRYELRLVTTELDDLTSSVNHTIKIIKNIKAYLEGRANYALDSLNDAIQQAGDIIPDADTKTVRLRTENGKTRVVNLDGTDVNLREGGGLRSSMGAFMRYVHIVLKANAQQFICFDESFFALSDTSTAEMRKFIEEMSKSVLIICIEQRSLLFEGMNKTTYHYNKDGKYTSIRREEVVVE